MHPPEAIGDRSEVVTAPENAWDVNHFKAFVAASSLSLTSIQYTPNLAPDQPENCVKSLLLEADGDPVLIIACLTDRVNLKAVAAHLGLSRKKLRMCPAHRVPGHCGYIVGGVPPFGHSQKLRTLIDDRVPEYDDVWAGSGTPSTDIIVSYEELLLATEGEVITLREAADPSPSPEPPALDLPCPWAPGKEVVEVLGTLRWRNCIGRVLLAATLLPLNTPTSPDDSRATAAQWRHPESGTACELQVIFGKTLERQIGRIKMLEVMRYAKSGSCLRLIGTPQRCVAPRAAGLPHDVVQMVVHGLEYRTAGGAPHIAAHPHITHVGAELLRGGCLAPAPAPVCTYSDIAPSHLYTHLAAVEGEQRAARRAEEAAAEEAAAEAAAVAATTSSPDTLSEISSAANSEAEPVECLPLGLSLAAVVTVTDAVGLAEARRKLLAPGPTTRVVGLDAEWEPFRRGAPKPRPPVRLLQLADRDTAFLLDMSALCSSASRRWGEEAEGDAEVELEEALTELDLEVSDFLAALLSSESVLKLGFMLTHDLNRLADSFPGLPVFKGPADTPIRGHVDMAAMATDVCPAAAEIHESRVSLSRVVQAVLGAPLDKSEQTSNWSEAELSPGQLQYAANDAHCLTRVFDELVAMSPTSIDASLCRRWAGGLAACSDLKRTRVKKGAPH